MVWVEFRVEVRVEVKVVSPSTKLGTTPGPPAMSKMVGMMSMLPDSGLIQLAGMEKLVTG